MTADTLFSELLQLLEQLIRTPSFSREEQDAADILSSFLEQKGLRVYRKDHNLWLRSAHWQTSAPTILLNSHYDTVKPATGWQEDPFGARWEGERLIGLGSNDAGGSLVCLLGAFLTLHAGALPYNLIMAATAEEEISGPKGIASILPDLGHLDAAIVGEPTQLRMAIAERGLMVLDGENIGKAGHAARQEGINALYLALDDIQKLRQFQFPKTSNLLGPVQVSVTQIEAGSQHNVVPDRCRYVVDVRVNEHYTNPEVLQTLQSLVQGTLQARSLRLSSSRMALDHPIVQSGLQLGLSTYGSPTLSDQALLSIPSLKIGPGASARSHTAGEYITRSELRAGLDTYIRLLQNVQL